MIRNRTQGFTLLELLVVIAIMGFLIGALVVAATGLKARAKIEKTAATIRRLDAGCEAYNTKFQDYPSEYAKLTAADVKSGKKWPVIKSDVYLYDYLGKPLSVVEGFSGGTSKKRNLEPFVEIMESERLGDIMGTKTVQILDAYEGPIWYELPGYTHGANFPDMSTKFDLTSLGPDRTTTWDKLNPIDDITNWTYDRK
ncbi:MAG: prepilin-type N-terminal cleavage/methylation domain-containing protein [Planctomycetes bacterium]|nr:prepilin-type N-terminal cleavage/methylation domain-containing protein [Planctomycetota bacterium]